MNYLRNTIILLDDKANKNWGFLFSLLVIFFSFKFISGAIFYTDNWSEYHFSIFLVSFLLFFNIIFGGKITPFRFILLFILSKIIEIGGFIDIISNWVFYNSPISLLFQNVGAKDGNVFLAMCFLLLGLISFIKLIFIKLSSKKWNFRLIFTILTIFSFTFITFIFHYVLIEKYFRKSINDEIKHMSYIYNIKDPQLFELSCLTQKYICIANGNIDDIANKIENKKFKSVLNPYIQQSNNNQIISGNFPIDLSKPEIYLLLSNGNKWIINIDSAGKSHAFSEHWLMFSLTFAHGFWLLFYIWLLLFHERKKFKEQ
jgi:hypothetical protein